MTANPLSHAPAVTWSALPTPSCSCATVVPTPKSYIVTSPIRALACGTSAGVPWSSSAHW